MSSPARRRLEEAAARLALLNGQKSWGYVSFACEACEADAAADNFAELEALIEHTRYDHRMPEGIEGIRAPKLVWSAAYIEARLGKPEPVAKPVAGIPLEVGVDVLERGTRDLFTIVGVSATHVELRHLEGTFIRSVRRDLLVDRYQRYIAA